jgi:hypothetical protein
VGKKGTFADSERWRLRKSVGHETVAAILIGPTLFTLILIMLNIVWPVPDPLLLGTLLVTLALCIAALVALGYISSIYHDHGFRSTREYPLEIRKVETAVGLLLVARETRSVKEVGTWRFRTRMQVEYRVRKYEDMSMVILVRPVKRDSSDEWTQVIVCHDIEDEERMRGLEHAIDEAVANPFALKLPKYHLEKEPELHMWKGGPPPQDPDVE